MSPINASAKNEKNNFLYFRLSSIGFVLRATRSYGWRAAFVTLCFDLCGHFASSDRKVSELAWRRIFFVIRVQMHT